MQQLELVVAGTSKAVLMVESEAAELSEDVMLGAVMFGHKQMQVAIAAINALVAEAGKPKWNWTAPVAHEGMIAAIRNAIGEKLSQAFQVRDKLERKDTISGVKKETIGALAAEAQHLAIVGTPPVPNSASSTVATACLPCPVRARRNSSNSTRRTELLIALRLAGRSSPSWRTAPSSVARHPGSKVMAATKSPPPSPA